MKHLLLFAFIIFLSCGETVQEAEDSTSAQKDTVLYGLQKHPFSNPNAELQDVLQNWIFYEDFYDEATTLHNLTIKQLSDKSQRLLAHTDSLMSKIPDTLNTFAIKSRLAIIKTRVELLQHESQTNKINAEKIEDYINETNTAVTNFLVQIEEKVLKDGIDLQRIENEKKELEKQKRYLDSIQQLELQDQKK